MRATHGEPGAVSEPAESAVTMPTMKQGVLVMVIDPVVPEVAATVDSLWFEESVESCMPETSYSAVSSIALEVMVTLAAALAAWPRHK